MDFVGCVEHCDSRRPRGDRWTSLRATRERGHDEPNLAGTPNESDASKRDRYEKEQEEIKSEAEHKEAAAKSNFHKHEVFARGVTMFQIAIAIAAISALTRKPRFWIVSLLFGAAGCAFLVLAAIAR
ncbi:MAG: hypothetical protein DMF28_10070 [Verrucomicrobia bacterium]|nr:MAG: hypothetical protein DMF28_10070 [Verrucomicrobiota bacterium]